MLRALKLGTVIGCTGQRPKDVVGWIWCGGTWLAQAYAEFWPQNWTCFGWASSISLTLCTSGWMSSRYYSRVSQCFCLCSVCLSASAAENKDITIIIIIIIIVHAAQVVTYVFKLFMHLRGYQIHEKCITSQTYHSASSPSFFSYSSSPASPFLGCRARMESSKLPSLRQPSPWCTVFQSWWSAQRSVWRLITLRTGQCRAVSGHL